MNKILLRELTIVFTVRVDSNERLNNVRATMAYYSKYTDCSMMLLEADSEPRLKQMVNAEFPHVDYMFVNDSNPIFHRTHYINEELRQVKTANAAVIDSDIIVPIGQLVEANNILLESDVVMALPYDGRAIGQDAYYSDLFRSNLDPDIFEAVDGNQRLMFGFISVGGAYLVDVNKYRSLGWENEHFPGWGPEDFEREHRVNILGYKPLRIEGKIHHLSHPRGINSSNSHEPLVLATKREYCKVCSMMPDELRQYVDTWSWIHR